MDDTDKLWKDILRHLEPVVGRPNVVTWLKPARIVGRSAKKLTISVPNHYAKSWIERHAASKIAGAAGKLGSGKPALEVVVLKPPPISASELPILQAQEEPPPKPDKSGEKNPSVNKKYTFDTFIVGNNNRLAFAAAQVVSEKPGETYNPLFVYGGVGLGKTHLMQAIGNAVLKSDPKKKVIYTSCETFTSEFIGALQNKTINDFKNKYRSVDVLLVDDIQFLANKEGTQEEFFHTFNILHQANRQIVITADRLPKEISDLEERLISRFGWGMIADIQPPNYETRAAILQAKAKQMATEVPSEVIDYIAKTITANVRELEGSLTKLIAARQVEGAVLTIDFTKRILRDLMAPQTHLSAKEIIRQVAKFFDVEVSDILGKKRLRDLVYPRQVAMYLMRELLHLSYPQIGQELGGKDHTTIMHGVQKIEKSLPQDPHLEQDIRQVIGNLT